MWVSDVRGDGMRRHPRASITRISPLGRGSVRPGDRTDHKGAQLVNEPGTWNFSDLNTREHVGEGDFTMWRVPGYGDFLELSDPDLRSRQGEFGPRRASRTRSPGWRR